jgi:hypothetical protein
VTAYTVAEDKIAKHDFTLGASTVDTVTFFDAPERVEVVSDGADEVYVTTDGSTPTVSGDNTYIIPALPCSRTIRMAGAVVKFISAGTPKVSVTRM